MLNTTLIMTYIRQFAQLLLAVHSHTAIYIYIYNKSIIKIMW